MELNRFELQKILLEVAKEASETKRSTEEINSLVQEKISSLNITDIKETSFSTVTRELNELYEKKNHDYGNSFGDTFVKLGIVSAVTRIYDKVNRIISLATKKERKVSDERIEDTLMDLANYSIMTLVELRKQKKCITQE